MEAVTRGAAHRAREAAAQHDIIIGGHRRVEQPLARQFQRQARVAGVGVNVGSVLCAGREGDKAVTRGGKSHADALPVAKVGGVDHQEGGQ